MSTNTPPNPNVDTFNTLYWKTSTGILTIEDADLRYLKFPVAQGTENLQTTNVNGVLTANAGVKTNIIEAIGTIIDIGKSRLLGTMNCNSQAFNNFRSFTGNGIQSVQFNSYGQNIEIFGDIDMTDTYKLTRVYALSNDSPTGLIIENLQDTDMTFKTDTLTRLTLGTTIKAYSDIYMNNLSIYDTIRLQNSSLVNNLLIESLNLPIAFEYLSLNKLTISSDILLGTNMNCQNNGIYNSLYIDGVSNTNLNISTIGTGDLQFFTGGSGVTNRLTFRDTGECLADSNGLYIQGTTNANSQVRLGYNAAAISQGIGSISIGGGAGTTQGINSVAIGQGAGTSQNNQCVAVGGISGATNQGSGYISSGDGAIAIGFLSGNTNQTRRAIAIGSGAGSANQGQSAIAIGYGAGLANQGTNSICIGTSCGNGSAAANSIALNSSGTVFNPPIANAFFVNPIRMTGSGSGFFLMYYNPTSKEVGYDSSSRRYKKDIEDFVEDTSVLHNFSPKSFKFIDHGEEAKTNYGFIAEELEEQNPILVGYDGEGLPQGINWNTITMFNICEVQKLRKELDGTVNVMMVMMEEIKKLKDEMELMRNEINELKGSSPKI
jgi:hypothetical protein